MQKFHIEWALKADNLNKMRKQYLSITTLLFLSIFHFTNSDNVSQFFEESSCLKCQCYRVKCSRLNNNSNCVDEFWGTCDNRIDIQEDSSDCNSKCDCCLNNGCYSWKTYQCIMYRSMFFSALFYMFMMIIMFNSLESLYLLMFNINYFEHHEGDRLLNKENLDEGVSEIEFDIPEKKSNENNQDDMQERIHDFIVNKINRYDLDINRVKINCSYSKFLYIRPNNDSYKDGKCVLI